MNAGQCSPERGNLHSKASRVQMRVPSRACQRCRTRHKKCDIASKRKSCSPCQKAGISCHGGGARTELQIRFSELTPHVTSPASASQLPDAHSNSGSEDGNASQHIAHVSPGPNDAVDVSNPESPVQSPYQDDYRSSIMTQSLPHSPHRNPSLHIRTSAESQGSPLAAEGSGHSQGELTWNPRSPKHISQRDPLLQHTLVYQPLSVPQSHESPQLLSRSHSEVGELSRNSAPKSWQLTAEQAQLVKHFLTYLLPWFDYLDPRAPFRSHIQATILQDQCILYAVLAVSARHLEAVSSARHESDEYERKCLELLIPAIRDSCTHPEPIHDSIFVMAVMQRCLEEMTGPHDRSTITHTVCASVLLRMKTRNEHPSDLVNAAMAVAMRQELYIANIIQRPMKIAGHHCGVDESLDPAPDFMWALRITSHTVRVTNYVYDSAPRSTEQWDQLWQYLDDWDRSKPPSFNPLNEVETSSAPEDPPSNSGRRRSHVADGTFPEVYYMSDPPIAARQYLEICKILLLAHDPRVSNLGLGRTASMVAREETIRDSVRLIVGIALSNPEYTAARILAGLSVGMAGELFTESCEIAQLLSIASQAEMHIGWPGLKVSQRLKEFWAVNSPHIG